MIKLPRRPRTNSRIIAAMIFMPAFVQTVQAQSIPGAQSQTSEAGAIVKAFDHLFAGPRSGQRAVHAKGVMVRGTFTPSAGAREISKAFHFNNQVPVIARFSNFAGIPTIADGEPDASPRGLSVRFQLPDGGEADLVAHSYNGFPAATPDEFLKFLMAVGTNDQIKLNEFLAAHAAAMRFVQSPKPAPESFATERFFGVNAFYFENEAGTRRAGRYFVEPIAGPRHLTKSDAEHRQPDYLSKELNERLSINPVNFKLQLQLAGTSDQLIDGSQPWPDDRVFVELGIISFTASAADAQQNDYLFTPLNLPEGVAPTDDPMLSARSRAYRISFDRRSAFKNASEADR